MELQAGIERLRASKKLYDEGNKSEGVEAGKEWALNEGEFDELEKVARLNEHPGTDPLEALRETNPDLLDSYDEEVLSDEWAEGFIEGAAEIYEQV